MSASSLYQIPLTLIDGTETSFGQFRGKTVLVVNVASKCGFTPQYAGLEALYQKYTDDGFVVLGLPCNQFGAQEPGTEGDIQAFCELNFGVSFPLTAKVDVRGKDQHPLYAELIAGQAEHDEAVVSVLLVQRFEASVLRGKSALGGHIDDQNRLASELTEARHGAIDEGERDLE